MIAGQTKVGGEQRGNLVGKKGGVSPMPITFFCAMKNWDCHHQPGVMMGMKETGSTAARMARFRVDTWD